MIDWRRALKTQAPAATILIRLATGAVFLSEGIQKFLHPAELGAGRFAKIGIPFPSFSGPFVGVCEILAGVLLLAGLLTRGAAATMIVNMTVAILSTKIPFFQKHGFWAALHEARTDWAMLLGSAFLLIVGAGPVSVDAQFSRKDAS
jgi:uncharacterized membrane protein YphA (DoxX/SURF4 family)